MTTAPALIARLWRRLRHDEPPVLLAPHNVGKAETIKASALFPGPHCHISVLRFRMQLK